MFGKRTSHSGRIKIQNILITDYHCASNRGDAAIMEGVISSLKEEFSDIEITVISNYPNSAELVNNVKSIQQKVVPFKWTAFKKNGALFYLLLIAKLEKHGVSVLSETVLDRLRLTPYIEADVIVSTGGGFLNDFYAPGNLGRYWGMLFGKLLGKTVVLYAQSIGPLKRTPYRQIARYILNKVDLVTLRDAQSADVLESLGVDRPQIEVTADAAFTMPLNSSKPLDSRRYENLTARDSENLQVSISTRKWSHYKSGGSQKQYEAAIAGTVDWLIREKGAEVVFASTCTGLAGYHTDDRVTAHDIIDKTRHQESQNPLVLSGEYTPQELIEFYETMDIHIGTRMHSNILSILAGTPVVGIEYEFKTGELLEAFELSDFVVNINNVTARELKQNIVRLIDERDKILDKIKGQLPKMKKKAGQNAELIRQLVERKNVENE